MAADQDLQSNVEKPRHRSWASFSLRSLLLLMVLVAVWLGGRMSNDYNFGRRPNLVGNWQARLPAGFVQPSAIRHLGGDRYQLTSGAGVFSGTYRWRDGQLAIEAPADTRMLGLIWKWDGQELLLIAEPAGTPTGSSYLGTVLSRPPEQAAKK